MAFDANVKLALLEENSHADATGNYTCTAFGSPVFSSDVKHDGSYSLNVDTWHSKGTQLYPDISTASIAADMKNWSEWTIEFWAYYTGAGSIAPFFQKGNTNLTNGFLFSYYYRPLNQLDIRFNGVQYPLNSFTMSLNTWHHFAYTYKAGTLKVYYDNSLVHTVNSLADNSFQNQNTGNYFVAGSTPLNGAGNGTNTFIDNFIISNIARTSFPTLPLSAPTITDISPNSGSVSGGTAVTITGTEFATGAAVTFGGDSATDVVVTSATEITCVTPAHTAGAVDVVVTNTDTGTVTKAGGFTYVTPTVADIHFTSAIYPQDFTVFLTDTDITNFQKEPYERNEELNVIDTFDFAFDKVTASAPLEFFKFLNNRAQNTLKIKNKSGNTIYIGKVSGVKSGMEINFANKSLFIESYPLIEDISTDFAIYNIAATNPIKIIKQLLDASVDAAYTVSKIHGLATVLSGISIAVSTDGEEENTKSIIQSICEAFNVGIYLEDLTVRAYAVQILPDDATDITPYLVNLRPKFKGRGDLYADKIMLTYTPTLGGTEATITAGTGDTAKEITISAPIFIDATSAGLAAERARAIYSQEFYEAEMEADKTAMFKLGDTVKYPSELGDFICLIIGKNTTRNQITYKVLGVLK